MNEIEIWNPLELRFQSTKTPENPIWDVEFKVEFVSPSGNTILIDGFWDGGTDWCVRFSPNEIGTWRWQTRCSDDENSGLANRSGTFNCIAYDGDNPLFVHGTPRVSADGSHLIWADGSPFFWLADTAWNSVLRTDPEDFDRYLTRRNEQGFTAVQFVCTQWRGCDRLLGEERAYVSDGDKVKICPEFFRKRDPLVKMINDHGLIAVPVILWALGANDPGQHLSIPDAVKVARYITARWGAYQVIWFLGGDGNYRGDRAQRWREIGAAVFGDRHDRLVTMHPCGQSWVGDEFRNEEWFDFIGYQSGHGDSTGNLRWLVAGPPATDWQTKPIKPVINIEPNYEMHPSYQTKIRFTDYEVRRASYWSLLVSPTAGVTYGNNPIWVWPSEPEVPEGHEGLGEVQPWHKGVDTPGIRSMSILKSFFDSIEWWRLRPAPELLVNQPGNDDPRRFIAVAKADGDLIVVYTPTGGEIELKLTNVEGLSAKWFNPRTGDWSKSETIEKSPATFRSPTEEDWVLCVQR